MSILRVRDTEGNIIDIPALRGPKGDAGDSYELTDNDRQEIADLVKINNKSITEDTLSDNILEKLNSANISDVTIFLDDDNNIIYTTTDNNFTTTPAWAYSNSHLLGSKIILGKNVSNSTYWLDNWESALDIYSYDSDLVDEINTYAESNNIEGLTATVISGYNYLTALLSSAEVSYQNVSTVMSLSELDNYTSYDKIYIGILAHYAGTFSELGIEHNGLNYSFNLRNYPHEYKDNEGTIQSTILQVIDVVDINKRFTRNLVTGEITSNNSSSSTSDVDKQEIAQIVIDAFDAELMKVLGSDE